MVRARRLRPACAGPGARYPGRAAEAIAPDSRRRRPGPPGRRQRRVHRPPRAPHARRRAADTAHGRAGRLAAGDQVRGRCARCRAAVRLRAGPDSEHPRRRRQPGPRPRSAIRVVPDVGPAWRSRDRTDHRRRHHADDDPAACRGRASHATGTTSGRAGVAPAASRPRTVWRHPHHRRGCGARRHGRWRPRPRRHARKGRHAQRRAPAEGGARGPPRACG